MSVQYRAVLWNPQKRAYDLTVLAAIILWLALFIGAGALLDPAITAETLIIRATGTGAFFLLHVILCIGPLCRLDPRFLPLLYNRRHLGVAMFVLALTHGVFSLVQFHAIGNVNPLQSVLTSNPHFGDVAQLPFQQLGLAALVVLFLMAATSHDFWLHTLTPRVWKRLHMAVYVAWALLVAHVLFGALQSQRYPLLAGVLILGVVVVTCLHVLASRQELRKDRELRAVEADGYVRVGALESIPEKRGTTVSVMGERIAVFRHDGKVSAVSNVCRHQNGPLGEGKIIDGCITCPWHGYQYDPATGCSPPPFTDKVPVYPTRVVDGAIYVHPTPLKEVAEHAGV